MFTKYWKQAAVLSVLALLLVAGRAEAAPLVWGNNSGNFTWDTTSANWGDGVTLYNNATPDSVAFGPAPSTALPNFATITVAPGLTPAAVTFTANGENSISGGWGGSGSLTKKGGGQLNVLSASTYTGGTFIDAGRLNVASVGLLGPAGSQNITIASGATLISGRTNFSGTLTMNGGAWEQSNGFGGSWTGPVILGANSTIANQHNVSINGTVSGTGRLTKARAGNLTLNGVNTYTGDTLISLGTITLADNAGLLFDIGPSGVNNRIYSPIESPDDVLGTLNLNGDFTFDLTDAGREVNDTWNIVDLASLNVTFGSTFGVNDFVNIGGGDWRTVYEGTTFTFSQSTGLLVAIPEPSTFALLGLAGMGLVGLGFYRRRQLA